jgi:hypothetical protein
MYTQEQITRMSKNPLAVVEALNALLDEGAMLIALLESLIGQEVKIAWPQSLTLQQEAVEIEYDPVTGFSPPRTDGAVRHKAWDDAIATSLASGDPAERGWAETRMPWMMIQDTLKLPNINATQRDTVLLNCSAARFGFGLGSEGKTFRSNMAKPITADQFGPRLADADIPDAFSLASDLTFPNGVVRWEGVWGYRKGGASDIPQFAKASLEHFLKTSGAGYKR